MPSSLAWAHQDVDDLSPDTLTTLQNTFGHNGTQDINVTKILAVQQKLQQEMKKRAGGRSQAEESCNSQGGQLMLMVDAPFAVPCTAQAPCLYEKECMAQDALPEGVQCEDRSPQAVSKLPLSKLRLFAQCHIPDSSEQEEPVEIKNNAGSSSTAQPEMDLESETEPAPEPQVANGMALRCAVCNHGTRGGCLNSVTGDCAPFDSTGVCPPDYGPCHNIPCNDVRAPCYNPLSPLQRPVCAPTDATRCRVLDPSKSVCLAQACPPGHIENLATQWQDAFYPDSTWYGRGLLESPLIPPDQVGPNDPQVWLPSGSNIVLPVPLGIDAYRSAPGSAWSQSNAHPLYGDTM